jgi:hypothetical protein
MLTFLAEIVIIYFALLDTLYHVFICISKNDVFYTRQVQHLRALPVLVKYSKHSKLLMQ